MAQLGDLVRAKALLRRAARAFGPKKRWRAPGASSPRPRSRSSRATSAFLRRRSTRRGRRSKSMATSSMPRMRGISRCVVSFLIGRIDEAEHARHARSAPFPPASRTAHELVVAGSRSGASGPGRHARRSLGPGTRRAKHGSCTVGGGQARTLRSEHARGAPDCERRGTTPPARGRRSVAGVEGIRRGRVPSRRA